MLISFINWRLKNLGKIFIDNSVFVAHCMVGDETLVHLFEKYFNVFVKRIIETGTLKILPLNAEISLRSIEISWKYGLLPNDALIATTCKHHGTTKIATFDSDFKRADFLEMIELGE